MAVDAISTITLDGRSFAVSDLPPAVQELPRSVQFVETKRQQLQAEIAVCQTAHVAYARELKAELEAIAAQSGL